MFKPSIQVLGLRYYKNPTKANPNKLKAADCYFEKGWQYPSIKNLFESLDDFYAKCDVPTENLFFTVANSGPAKRQFCHLEVLAFDVDGISAEDLESRFDEYPLVVSKFFGVEKSKLGIVCSGHGVHVYLALSVPIVGLEALKQTQGLYKVVCDKLNELLHLSGLSGKFDTTVLDGARILRLPGSLNKKPNKNPALCVLKQIGLEPCTIDLAGIVGVTPVSAGDSIDPKNLGKISIDNKAIWDGCAFMANSRANSSTLQEPQWYAGLSITCRMTDPLDASKLISQGHPDYSEDGTRAKMQQARDASGPLTCKRINELWGNCQGCKNYQTIMSPILLKRPTFIATQNNGFHDLVFNEATGSMKLGKPNVEDLRKFYELENSYKSQGRVCWQFNGTHWQETKDEELNSFAHKHFDPKPMSLYFDEFRKAVYRTNLADQFFWLSAERKINFKNGVYDIDKKELLPHSPEYGFKYCLDYDYVAGATAPRFLDFLNDVCCGDKDLAYVLLEFFGYAISGDKCHRVEKFLLLQGEGANGKSTLINIFKRIIGEQAYSTIMLQNITHEYSLAMLDGKLANITEEIEANKQNTDILKVLTSGGEVHARQIYKSAYKFFNRAKLIFACNELPKTFDVTDGFFRRAIVVPFNAKFSDELGNKDPMLLDKLTGELSGIVNLMLEGYERFVAQGRKFTGSRIVNEALTAYKHDLDPIRQWADDCLEIYDDFKDEQNTADLKTMYANYAEWCEECNYPPRPFDPFCKNLARVIPKWAERSVRKSIREGAVFRKERYALGVRLLKA